MGTGSDQLCAEIAGLTFVQIKETPGLLERIDAHGFGSGGGGDLSFLRQHIQCYEEANNDLSVIEKASDRECGYLKLLLCVLWTRKEKEARESGRDR